MSFTFNSKTSSDDSSLLMITDICWKLWEVLGEAAGVDVMTDVRFPRSWEKLVSLSTARDCLCERCLARCGLQPRGSLKSWLPDLSSAAFLRTPLAPAERRLDEAEDDDRCRWLTSGFLWLTQSISNVSTLQDFLPGNLSDPLLRQLDPSLNRLDLTNLDLRYTWRLPNVSGLWHLAELDKRGKTDSRPLFYFQ